MEKIRSEIDPAFKGDIVTTTNDKILRWQKNKDYVEGDIVKFHGSTYTCVKDHFSTTRVTPWTSKEYWLKSVKPQGNSSNVQL